MDISKLNSLLNFTFYFYILEEVEGKRPFLNGLNLTNELIIGKTSITEKIYKLTAKIKSLIKQGDRCLILSENRPYWLMTDIA